MQLREPAPLLVFNNSLTDSPSQLGNSALVFVLLVVASTRSIFRFCTSLRHSLTSLSVKLVTVLHKRVERSDADLTLPTRARSFWICTRKPVTCSSACSSSREAVNQWICHVARVQLSLLRVSVIEWHWSSRSIMDSRHH